MTVATAEVPHAAGTLTRPLVSLAPPRDHVDLRKCRRRAHKLLKKRCKQGGVHAVAADKKGAVKAQRHIDLFLSECTEAELLYLQSKAGDGLLPIMTLKPMDELLLEVEIQAFETCTMGRPLSFD